MFKYIFIYLYFFNISLFPKTSERKLYDQPATLSARLCQQRNY